MILGEVFQSFIEKSPISVMARIALEYSIRNEDIDLLFERNAKEQYTRSLLFSQVVNTMGIVVSKIKPSIHAAYQANKKNFTISVQSLYNKLDGIEPNIGRALVQHVAQRTSLLVEEMGATFPEMIPGYKQLKIIDGNHLAATQHRLKELQTIAAGPLPGFSLPILDPRTQQIIDAIPCEDGHAQERSLTKSILELVKSNDVWMADRNFCTTALIFGIVQKYAFFIIRHHKTNAPWKPLGKLVKCGVIDENTVWEQKVKLRDGSGKSMIVRRITVELEKPTRDGDNEIHILTNLPSHVLGDIIGRAYRGRWSIELAFNELEAILHSEINTLGYPKAALFAFDVAIVAYNQLSVLKAALRAKHGAEKIKKEVSPFYIANEIAQIRLGMDIAIPPQHWRVFETANVSEVASLLVDLAGNIDLGTFRRHPRGPKKPQAKRVKSKRRPHVSTARLLILRKEKEKKERST